MRTGRARSVVTRGIRFDSSQEDVQTTIPHLYSLLLNKFTNPLLMTYDFYIFKYIYININYLCIFVNDSPRLNVNCIDFDSFKKRLCLSIFTECCTVIISKLLSRIILFLLQIKEDHSTLVPVQCHIRPSNRPFVTPSKMFKRFSELGNALKHWTGTRPDTNKF